ncbi:MAG: ATP-binding cassette domain-containing protein [Chryseolinea sp.]
MNTIELVDVSYKYSDVAALSQASMSFESGKITGIIGKSGSGKSTLLKLVNGLLKPSTGEVVVFGKPLDYQNLQTARLQMGYMVQGTGLFPHLNVEQNISIAGRIKGLNTVTSRVSELLELVGLANSYKSKYPNQLSGGEQQRIGLCRALFLDPAVLLMDEPLGALDPVTRYEIQQELLNLQRLSSRTILFVTHDMLEARRIAERLLVIDRGVIQQYDTTETVLLRPANALVKSLIESSTW